MKLSNITWKPNKLSKLSVYFSQSENDIFRLFCISCMLIVITGCSFWPESIDRELSISHRSATLPPNIDSEYLTHLLGISKKRYVELKNVGAEYCLPGQMLWVSKKQDLIEHEIDGDLLLDARMHMQDLFSHLYNIKNQVENNNPSKKCYEYFSVIHPEPVQRLGVWDKAVDIDMQMEAE